MPAAPQALQLGHRHHRGPKDVVGGGGGARFSVDLGDVALPNGSSIKAVNIGIDQIIVTDAYGNDTTVAQYSTPKVVNVMQYQGGNTTPIAQGNISQTTYSSLTIVVDTASSGVVSANNASRQISFVNEPTSSTSGFGSATSTSVYGPGQVAVTFNRPFQTNGSSVTLDVDMNVMESVLPGRVTQVRPSLSVAQQGFEGFISGNLTNASGSAVTNAVVTATAGNGSIAATTYTDSNGNFLLHTLAAGTYTLTVYNQYVSASGWTIDSANSTSSGTVSGPSATVVPGQTSQVGTIAD
jgi:Carboxypeptidase regulatory-like domain/Domain of unknown function (DUF4382)